METKLTEVQRRVFEVGVKPQICYQRWVDEVCAFLKTTAPYLGDGGRHCNVFQSKPVLDKQPDILFLTPIRFKKLMKELLKPNWGYYMGKIQQ